MIHCDDARHYHPWITSHAIDRYIERWRATASRSQAIDEIGDLYARSACFMIEHQPDGIQQVRFARLGDRRVGIVVACTASHGSPTWIIRTVLPDPGI